MYANIIINVYNVFLSINVAPFTAPFFLILLVLGAIQ